MSEVFIFLAWVIHNKESVHIIDSSSKLCNVGANQSYFHYFGRRKGSLDHESINMEKDEEHSHVENSRSSVNCGPAGWVWWHAMDTAWAECHASFNSCSFMSRQTWQWKERNKPSVWPGVLSSCIVRRCLYSRGDWWQCLPWCLRLLFYSYVETSEAFKMLWEICI